MRRARRSRAADPLAQLGCRLLGERDRQDPPDVDAVLDHGPHEALDQHRGLAAAGAGVEQQVAVAALDRHQLLVGELQPSIAAQQIPGCRQPLARARLRAWGQLAGPHLRRQRQRRASISESSSSQLLAAEGVVAVDVAADGRGRLERPPRPQLAAGQRLVEAGDRLDPEQLRTASMYRPTCS